MNSSVCVDASLVLKLVLPEADSDRAHRLWRSWLETDTDGASERAGLGTGRTIWAPYSL